VDGTFDALRCCRQGYQLMTPRRPSQRDRMKGLLAAPCGVKDCRDGKNRRQGFHKAGWRKIDLDEARAIAPDEAAMYAEIKNGNGLVVRLVWGGQPGLFVPRISGIEVV
jgi:hypothetical protein